MRFAIDDRNHKLQVHITKCTGRHVKMILFKFPGFFSFRTFAFLNTVILEVDLTTHPAKNLKRHKNNEVSSPHLNEKKFEPKLSFFK